MTIAQIYENFTPDIAEVIEEAVERSGADPMGIGARHITSIKRSISFMLNSEWALFGMRQFMIKYESYTTQVGVPTFVMPPGAIDIFDAVLLRSGNATPINRMSRSEYLEIPNKTMTGRPDRYFVDRQATQNNVTVWRSPENNTDQIQYYYFRQMSRPGQMSNTLDMPPIMLEAFVAGLAAKYAQKFQFEKFQILWQLYCGGTLEPGKVGGVLKAAVEEDRDRADFTATVVLNPRGNRRR